ncbi:BNR Asp-box repeat domain protein [Lipomyces arxii]|uniref:BNR Asp-box repeat domain protein n=1 Tax=Lipomyces arxii TaxID=56418 RepID=UPI0034CECBCF
MQRLIVLNIFLALFSTCLASFGHRYPVPFPKQKVLLAKNITVFDPPENYNLPRTLYARAIELKDGTLLATWENYSPEPPLVYFPIFKSKDQGKTWKHISNVTDTVNGWGLRYQPDLLQLKTQYGQFPPGTILCAGNSIPSDLSRTRIDVYASFDNGYTWKFVSHVAEGGEAIPDNGLTPIWEPFFMEYGKKLVLYYSDQRDNATHGQKLVHTVTKNVKKWSPPVDDVVYDDYYARPGMTTVAKLPNGKYLMTYEYGGGPGFSTYQFPVYYRTSDSPLSFDSAPGIPLVATDGTIPFSSPTVTWSPVGGRNGTLIVSSQSNTEVFLNQALGAPNAWIRVPTGELASYTRRVYAFSHGRVLIIGGGQLSGADNIVHLSTYLVKDFIA